MNIRRLVPPSVAAVIGRKTAEMREYESFNHALSDSDSYEDPRLVEIVLEKTRRYRETLAGDNLPSIKTRQTAQNMFVLSYVDQHRGLNVIEVGGACGAAYFEANRLLPGRIERWSIVETPAMAAAGKRLADSHKLSFHTDLDSAAAALETRDLGIAQGAVQYASDPLGLLKALFNLGLGYVYVTRTVAARSEGAEIQSPIYTKQETQLSAHGPGSLPAGMADSRSSQPLTIASENSIFSAIPQTYEVLWRFEESSDESRSIGGRTVTVHDIGFLAKARH